MNCVVIFVFIVREQGVMLPGRLMLILKQRLKEVM